MKRTRASKIIAAVIAVNVLLGIFAAWVILSPEYYALDQAIRKGKSLPRPPRHVTNAVMAVERPWFVTGSTRGALREIFVKEHRRLWLTSRPCGRICRMRRAIIIGLRRLSESDETLLRAYIATVYLGEVNGRAIAGFQEAAPAYFKQELAVMELPQCASLAGMIRWPVEDSPAFPYRALSRRQTVLKLMLFRKFITDAEYERANAAPLIPYSALADPGS